MRRHPTKIRGNKVFVYRFNNALASPVAGQPLCAKPCPLCGHSLREAGVGRVIWIDNDGTVQSVRGKEFPQLTGDPAVITRLFLDQAGHDHHGKFMVQKYIAS